MSPSGSTLPLWWASPTLPFPSLEGETDAEVIVIGAGITGVTLAYTLAERGAAVVLMDSGPIAGSASGRNAGFLLASPSEPYSEMVALWGRAGARAVLEAGRRSHQRVRELVETLGIDCDYRSNGSLRLTRTEEEAEDIRASIPVMKADGFSMYGVAVEEAVPAAAAGRFVAAFFTREDGEIHPVRFLHGVARAAIERGVRVFAHSGVVGARWRDGVWEARTAAGLVRGRTLVLATNAYAAQLCPALEPLIRPRRGQMLATVPLEREVFPRPIYAHWGYQYWRQTPDRRLLIGGWRDLDLDGETGFEDVVTEPIQSAIERGLIELIPEGAPIEYRWTGVMGFARDGRPLVGWLDAAHHLAICAGYTAHGMGMAASCTLDLAEMLNWKRAPGISTFDPGRFPELQDTREGVTSLGVRTQA